MNQTKSILHELGRERMNKVSGSSMESAEDLYKAVRRYRALYLGLMMALALILIYSVHIIVGLIAPMLVSLCLPPAAPLGMTMEEIRIGRQWGRHRRKLKKLPQFKKLAKSLSGVSGKVLHQFDLFQHCKVQMQKMKDGRTRRTGKSATIT